MTPHKEQNLLKVPVLIPKQRHFLLQFSKLQQFMLLFFQQFLHLFSFFLFQLQQLETQSNQSFLLDQNSSDLYLKLEGSQNQTLKTNYY